MADDDIKARIEGMHWENARIERTELGYEDHGIMTVNVMCSGTAWGQAFGGRALSDPAALKHFIEGVLAVCSRNWEGVRGGMIRVGRCEPYGRIEAIRPILSDYPVFAPGNDLDVSPGLIKE